MIDFKDRVKSPFEDDNFIKDLIIKYLQAGDIYKFYDLINEIGKETDINNFAYDIYMSKPMSKNFSHLRHFIEDYIDAALALVELENYLDYKNT